MDPKNKPTQLDPKTVEDKVKKARTNLEVAVKDFIKLLDDRVLDERKSQAHKNTEKQIADNLFKASVALDRENVDEGKWALMIATLRTNLKMRDRINQLDYLLHSTIRDLKNIEQQLGIKKDDKSKGKPGAP